ncbi:heterogeneous nuclear ribonucleoprotein 1-like [Senna tora]|uniref:Heterogeneous nuclear ribonucleoprotein 1-like n=1 Tax=Senna tora TaxID=362788 RepID=A0A834XBH6_9FABA|nr:heterogeneous nuclear ribonucleoprotein 1-like [Senna tora]
MWVDRQLIDERSDDVSGFSPSMIVPHLTSTQHPSFLMGMDPGKLFIGGISWDTNEERLRQYFQNFGDVVEAVIMKDRTTGRARGFGFIVFADPSVAERVVMEKHVIDGRTVEAKKAVPRDDQNILNRSNGSMHGSPGPTRTKKIFVGGLASTVTESDFKKYFDQFGTITDVVVMYDHNTQRPRGFGFITYDSEEAVDRVLYKTFHELNGKMVEVKRAVPKELSPSPSRGQLAGYNYGLSRVSGFSNGFIQGYNPSLVGGHGLRADGRFSPVTVGRNGYPPLSPSYGTGFNFEPAFSQNGNSNLASTLFLGRSLNPSYNGNSSRYHNAMGYAGTTGGINSTASSTNQSLWGNENLNYATNPANSDVFLGYGSQNSSMGSFGNIGTLWSSSPSADQVGTVGSGYGKGSQYYGSGDTNLGAKAVGYGKNSEAIVDSASSYGLSDGNYDAAYKNIYEAGSFFGDHTWRSSPSELEDNGSLGYDLGNAVSDLMSKSSGGHIGAYTVANRQSNRGNTNRNCCLGRLCYGCSDSDVVIVKKLCLCAEGADAGNNNHLNTRAKANIWPYGIDLNNVRGRFTNGKTGADFAAINLGLPIAPPYLNLSSSERSRIVTGINYASGACGILNTTREARY